MRHRFAAAIGLLGLVVPPAMLCLKYAPDIIGLPGMVADIAVWRDEWIPWLSQSGYVVDVGFIVLISVSVATLIILLWPEWRGAMHKTAAFSARTSHSRPEKLEDKFKMSVGESADLVPMQLILRGTRSDDGIDIEGIIQYRNRSKGALVLNSIAADFEVSGRRPVGKLSMGVSSQLPSEKTDSIRFNPIRVYREEKHNGQARFATMFGSSRENMAEAVDMFYTFTILSYPKEATDMPMQLEANITASVQYYKKG